MLTQEHLESICQYFLKCITDEKYSRIIDVHLSKGNDYLVMLEGEELIHYNLMVGAAYQELGQLENADLFFDNYLYLVNGETLEKILTPEAYGKFGDNDESAKRFALLMFELGNLGLKYISPEK